MVSVNGVFMAGSPSIGLRGLGGEPGCDGLDISIAQASGDGPHEILRVVGAIAGLPGPQLCLDVAGMLTGNARENGAGPLVVRSMAALAG